MRLLKALVSVALVADAALASSGWFSKAGELTRLPSIPLNTRRYAPLPNANQTDDANPNSLQQVARE